MWRAIFQILIAIALGITVFYLLPADIKEKAIGLLKYALPDTVEEKIESLIYTPVERREKLIDKLEDKMTRLKNIVAAKPQISTVTEEIASTLKETEDIIAKIKEANEEQGPVNKVTAAITKKAAEILIPSDNAPENAAPSSNNSNCNN